MSLLLAWAVSPAFAQQEPTPLPGIVDDWTTQHVVFSNPGTMEEAIANGKLDEWQQIVTEPRYQMQQVRRRASSEAMVPSTEFGSDSPDVPPPISIDSSQGDATSVGKKMRRDWSLQVAAGANTSVAPGMYPAKYSFSPVGSPDCAKDFVVFPIIGPGATNHENVIGVNNLYKTICTGTVPTVLFSYFVGTGVVQTSAVLSLDGSKVAVVESVTNGSILHVITIDKSGNAGCPSSTPCNGTSFNSPAVPGTHNNAVDTKITLSGGVSVTRSSPFVDYKGDIAYVGDDTGKLHKITGVFKGTPAEAGSPWPVLVSSGIILTGPVFDPGASKNIFVAGSKGSLWCITAAGAACSTRDTTIAGGTAASIDVPIVDSTTQKVFAAANNTTNAVLMQVTTSLGSPVRVTMGAAGTDLFDGAFDHAYFTSVSTGHMYFCGNLTTAATPTLWRVSFDSGGTMSSTNDGKSFEVVAPGSTGSSNDCTPLTEVFNSNQGKDYLFLGVKGHGFSSGTPNCAGTTCLMSFVLPASTFPTAANATFTTNLGSGGISGIIVDNVSGLSGASQIYFGNAQNDTAVQVSQSALQ